MLEAIQLASSPTDFLAVQKHVRVSTIGDNDRLPGVVYVNGFKSIMEGRKVAFLQHWAAEKNMDLIAYDHHAHGQSSGDFKDATIGRWFQDLCLLLETQTRGPQVLVGYSMGFWISILVALKAGSSLRERVTGLLGIAPSINSTEKWIAEITDAQLKDKDGVYRRRSEYSATGWYDVPVNLLVESRRHFLQPPHEIRCPVRLIHGLEDPDVSHLETLALMHDLRSEDVDLLLVKDGDHRLSRKEDLAKIANLLESLCALSASRRGKITGINDSEIPPT